MSRKLFGTDGVRGVAGEFLTAELALALGRAATLQTQAPRPQVLIIRDTRESGEMLQAAVAAGLPVEVERSADARIRIPMASGIESLNAAAAAVVLFYEAARQRKIVLNIGGKKA